MFNQFYLGQNYDLKKFSDINEDLPNYLIGNISIEDLLFLSNIM